MPKRKLSVQQRKRIAALQDERRKRLQARREKEIQTLENADSHHGLVISRYGPEFSILDTDTEQRTVYHCLTRQNIGYIACGDNVVWEKTSSDPKVLEGVVTALIDRQTVLTRSTFSESDKPLAANISQLIIVLAPQPEPSEYLIDQYLIAAERIGIKAIIVINKADLLDNEQKSALHSRFQTYEKIGYHVVFASTKTDNGLQPLLENLTGETSILVGQSGVGKSSLTNTLLPELDLETQKLSEKKQLGQHTTSASTLYFLDNNARLIDSPGVRSFRPGTIEQSMLENGYREFKPFLGHCKFSNCSHSNEPGCALIEACKNGDIAPIRLENFRHIASKLKEKL
ncbi:MAG: small ribosomal subunit biogenesis GTPase RsgA [Gammaproteobacteria bacterium]|nr:small ribosomal subunit biogenesis GTPase RsgA [Gammaproteobacteria bacterium]NNJ90514.1 small ribosomal subunit biogenesis GTPase RsgA [Gammaproteobacteria bacterium]